MSAVPQQIQAGQERHPPRLVLDVQAQLHDRLASPSVGMVTYIYGFARQASTMLNRQDETLMWWPWKAALTKDAAAAWCRDVAKSLFQARTFQVTSEMCEVADKLYESQEQGIFYVQEAELPAPDGFCWLDKPLMVTDARGNLVVERAFSWGTTAVRFAHPGIKRTDGLGRPLEPLQETVPALRLTTWNWTGDFHLDHYMAADPDSSSLLAQLADLTISHTLVVPFGERFPFHKGKSPHPEGAPGDFQPDNTAAWVHVLWMLMEQEIVTFARPPRSVTGARRHRRSIKHGDISVVLLRRAKSHQHDPDGVHREVDWNFRWLVQGHHRHIGSYTGPRHHAAPMPGGETCSVCWANGEQVRITWVKSHIKGPDDRPLRSSETLYKLAR